MCLLVLSFGSAVASAQNAPSDEVPLEHIELRDQLIAAQESLLNAYRCQFDIDTHVVQGGCTDDTPTQGPIQPTPFDGTPTQYALDVRDRPVENQEALLNVYRCLFNINTHIVPDGCGEPPPENPFTTVSVSGQHACGIRADQTIACWGTERVFPLGDPPSGAFADVVVGQGHACGIRTEGTIECWGSADLGTRNPPSGTFSAIAEGTYHLCGLRINGFVDCWGINIHGRPTSPPAGTFSALSAGRDFSCGIRVDGTVDCWGDNRFGQVDAPEGTFTQIASHYRQSCGLRSDGAVVCWGPNAFRHTTVPGR